MNKNERMKIPRVDPRKRPAEERLQDFREIYEILDRQTAIEQANRCVECKKPPCELACPAHNHIRDWLVLTAQGKLMEAAALSWSTSNMTEVCGRICPQDRLCENKCIVGIKHEPVAIGPIEAFLSQWAWSELGGMPKPEIAPATGRKVAVIGSGPAGLACAEELTKQGHTVTVFEAYPKPGGLLIYGIPGFKLDKDRVDRRVGYLESLGIEFVCNTRVGVDLTLEAIFERGYEAIFLGTGAMKPKQARLQGEDLEGVHEAIPFLLRNNLDATYMGPGYEGRIDLGGRRVVILGGGDTAMDCLRTSVRSNADSVTCVYRRDEENMPGSRREVRAAKEEGVKFHFYTQPLRFVDDGNGRVKGIDCIRMELGEPDDSGRRRPIPVPGSDFHLETDFIILAFGFDASPVPNVEPDRFRLSKWGTYEIDDNGMTSWKGVFAGGDSVNGADLIVTAMRDGRRAAMGIHDFLS
jgi:glutamate synthase (NADPH/NADH) small chain